MSSYRRHFAALTFAATLSAPAALADVSLAGCWVNARNNNLPCYVDQRGSQLVFTNENGSTSLGRFIGPATFMAYQWGNLRGWVGGDGNVIYWDGNGMWIRDPYCGGMIE